MNIYKYLFVFIGIVLAMPIRGEERVSQDTFEQMVDYVNATVVGTYLSGRISIAKLEKINIDAPISYDELVIQIMKSKEATTVAAFCKRVNGTKEKYKENLTVEQLLSLLFPTDRDKLFYEAKGPEKLNKLRREVGNYLKSKVLPSQVEENCAQDNTAEQQVKDSFRSASSGGGKAKDRNLKDGSSENTPSTNKGESSSIAISLWSIVPILISLLACVVSFIFYKRNSQLNKEMVFLSEKLDHIETRITKELGLTKEVQQKTMNGNSVNKLLEGRVNELQMNQASLSRSIEKIEKILEEGTGSNPDVDVDSASDRSKELPEKVSAYTSVYVITPYEGSFGQPSTQHRSNHNYEIRIFPNAANEGKIFTLNSVDSVKRYLNDPDMVVNPVCEATTTFNPLAIRVVTVKPGRVTLVNDRWVIQEKIMIAYE